MKKSKNKFRVGQTVQSIYDATHRFVIDKSVAPERIFHEKGSNRWWTRNELQRLGARENPATSFRLNGKNRMRGTHPHASTAVFGVPFGGTDPRPGLKQTRCLECGISFRQRRRWQKFHSEACRRAHWKRKTLAREPDQTLRAVV